MRPVILVSLDFRRPQDGKSGLGTSSIAAALEANNIPWRIIDEKVNCPDFSLDDVFEKLSNAIKEFGRGCLVGFGTYVWNDKEVCSLISRVKVLGVRIVLGGPQISYTERGQLENLYPEADYFVRGHGEVAMVSLAQGAFREVPGIHVAGKLDLGLSASANLQELPSPYLLGLAKVNKNIRWETQRGCPYKCSFCQHRAAGKWRKGEAIFDEQRLETELNLFASKGVKRISVLDPIFHVDQSRAIQILDKIKGSGLDAEISLQCRFETFKPEFLNALAGLNVTLEFGLQTVVEAEYTAIERPNKMDHVDRVARELLKRKIDFEVSLIYGLPNQTLASFRESVEWCSQHNVPRVRAWPLMLLRGTPLYDQKGKYGLKERPNDEGIPIVVSSRTFSESEYMEMARIANSLENTGKMT